MKLSYSFEMVELGDEVVAVPVGKNSSNLSGVLKLNKEGREIIDALKDDISEEELINKLSGKYSNREEIEIYVRKIIDYLNQHQMLE